MSERRRKTMDEKSRRGDINAMAKSLMNPRPIGNGGYIYNQIKRKNKDILKDNKVYNFNGNTYQYKENIDSFIVKQLKDRDSEFKDSVNSKIIDISIQRIEQDQRLEEAVEQLKKTKSVVKAVPVVQGEIVSSELEPESEPGAEPEPETKPEVTDLVAEQMRIGRAAGYPDLPMLAGENIDAYFRRLKEHYERLKKQERRKSREGRRNKSKGCCGSRPTMKKKNKKKQTRRRKSKATNKRKPKQTRRYKRIS